MTDIEIDREKDARLAGCAARHKDKVHTDDDRRRSTAKICRLQAKSSTWHAHKVEELHPAVATAYNLIDAGLKFFPVYGLQAKTKLCQCGWFACKSPGKHPVWQHVANGVYGATDDIAKINAWFRARPDANLGIVPGDDISIIDGDPRNGGDVSKLNLPSTLETLSGGGGQHLYFKNPPGFAPGKSEPWTGIELFNGNGCYVVGPPSGHKSGGCYRWAPGHGPGEIEIAELPDWIVEKLQRAPRPEPVQTDFKEEGPRELELELIKSALSFIPNHYSRGEPGRLSYDEYIAIGIALKVANAPEEWWLDWASQCPDTYPRSVNVKKWRSFSSPEEWERARPRGPNEKPIKPGTLFNIAERYGWSWGVQGRAIEDAYDRWLERQIAEANRDNFEEMVAYFAEVAP